MSLDSSPRSILSQQDAIPNLPDPDKIVELLMTKGQQTRTYDSTSRESTPDITADAKHWIDRIEGLQNRISCFDNTFNLEEWRQNNIVDGRYWRIEADHWESYYADECKVDQSWQEKDLFRTQQAQHDFCFFRDASQFNWLLTYTGLSESITEPLAAAQDESRRSVFETVYHRYRARYWTDLCQKRGYTQVRGCINALNYWRTEFACIHRKLLRLERRSLDTESKPFQKARVSKRTKNTRTLPNGGDKKSSRRRARDMKPTAVNVATNVRRSARLSRKRNLA